MQEEMYYQVEYNLKPGGSVDIELDRFVGKEVSPIPGVSPILVDPRGASCLHVCGIPADVPEVWRVTYIEGEASLRAFLNHLVVDVCDVEQDVATGLINETLAKLAEDTPEAPDEAEGETQFFTIDSWAEEGQPAQLVVRVWDDGDWDDDMAYVEGGDRKAEFLSLAELPYPIPRSSQMIATTWFGLRDLILRELIDRLDQDEEDLFQVVDDQLVILSEGKYNPGEEDIVDQFRDFLADISPSDITG